MCTPLPTAGLNTTQSTFTSSRLTRFQPQQAYNCISNRVRLLSLLIALIAGLSQGNAQCPSSNTFLNSQAQVNNFHLQYPTCTSIPGLLTISGPDITDLSSLSAITSVTTQLRIENNPLLTSLSGLNSLTGVRGVGNVVVSANASLTSLSGLNNLTRVASIDISDNPQLSSLEALQNVSTAIRFLDIIGNTSLTSLSGLGNIPSLGVNGTVTISDNPALASLSGLASLTLVSGTQFTLSNNASLTSLSGLTNVITFQPDNLDILNNPLLSACTITPLCQRLAGGSTTNISNNGPGCNSVAEVQSACAGTDIGIITQPPSQSAVLAGASVSVPVSATGNITAYQWYKGSLSSPVAGQTSATLSLSNVTTSDAGSYLVVISSPSTSLTSTAFTLSVTNPPIRYVKAGGSGDGTSWATASGDLQAMIDAEGTQQVWVAQGTYKPTTTTDRGISFIMKNGVSILGGFPDSGDPGLTQRNPASFITILSGDIGTPGDNTDNSYHVVYNITGLTSSAVLDGFVITAGKANEGAASRRLASGAGMYNENSSPTLINCLFIHNVATSNSGDGGGMNNVSSNPTLINCSFANNSTSRQGGGMYNSNSSPTLINCSFANNSASDQGGGIYNSSNSSSTLTNCVLFGNGGANTISNSNSTLTASYSLFESNVTGYTSGPGNLTTTTSPFAGTATTQLANGSPAINAGNSLSYTAAGGPPTDLAGNVRIQNGTIDMGAYEFSLPTDLIPLLYVSPSLAYSTTTGSVVVDVFEINLAPTSGPITVFIPKTPQLRLSFDPNATSFVGKPVQNSAWSFDGTSDPTAYILTTNQGIGAGGKLSVGLNSILTPGLTKGTLSVTATLVGTSGGEVTVTNNTDADKLEYFSK